MFRLLVPFGILFFATLMIAGRDNGQMRPGLARAIADGQEIVMVERRMPAPVTRRDTPVIALAAAPAKPAPAPAVVTPAVAEAPAERPAPPARVFTLSALPTLGGDQARLTEVAAEDGQTDSLRYVRGNLVNVRLGPSTDTAVVGQLTLGEAVTVLGAVDSDWVEIVIEGDGMRGYVAARLLGRQAP